ncbi:acetate--CoA ligase [Candidatus Saccharibacteria bacterium]|nr:MAG: acetate--CoA ligase [Candidatus Saccharibacteria bacterium]
MLGTHPDRISKTTNPPRQKPNIEDYDLARADFSWQTANSKLFGDVADVCSSKYNITYNCVDRHAEDSRRDKTALLYAAEDGSTERFTYADLKKQTNKFANVLSGLGVNKNDRVFIFMPAIPERYIAFLGILKLGAVVGTMFAAFQEEALLDRLSDSEASVVVTNTELLPRIQNIQSKLPCLQKIIVVQRGSTELPVASNVVAYEAAMQDASDSFQTVAVKPEDFAYMLYTSGTTGKPKGVIHSHSDIVQAMATTSAVLDIQENDIYWCTADIGWVTGVVYGVLGIWGLGGTSVLYEGRFSPENWYRVLQDHKVTVWYSAPTAIRMLMGSGVDTASYDFSHLRHLCSVGEPSNPEAIWWGLEVFGLPFHDTWWQTELGGICISNLPALDIKPGSMGKPLPGIEAAILDPAGNVLAPGQQGSLALRASTVQSLMKTIWHNQGKYDSYFIGDWYISGDSAYCDADGYFWFVGRNDDVINTAGERIGPFEVESALVEHPNVVEAAVIGKPDAVRGEIIKAFVVLKDGVKTSDELKKELQQFVKSHLSGHSYPREIDFIDHLPKTRSGKIMRRVLKAKELGLPTGDTSTLENY